MEDIILLLIQAFVELIVNILSVAPWDFLYTSTGSDHWGRWILPSLLIGGLIGGLTTIFLPNPFVHNHTIRLVMLGVGPVCSGFSSIALAKLKSRKGDFNANAHFWLCFSFTLSFVLVRFAYTFTS